MSGLHAALTALLAAVAASPASAGRICATLEAEGLAIPAGFVSCAGPTEVSMARLRDGHFCLDDLAPGDYRLAFTWGDMQSAENSRAALRGAAWSLNEGRLTIDASGRACAYAPGGSKASCGELALVYRAGTASADAALAGRVDFPDEGGNEPFLLQLDMAHAGVVSPQFVRLPARAKGERTVEFVARLPPGRLVAVHPLSRRWALVHTRPALAQLPELASAATASLSLELAPAAPLSGRVFDAAGKPVRPRMAGSNSEFFPIYVESPSGRYRLGTHVDRDGAFEFLGVLPGLRFLQAGWSTGPRWQGGRHALTWPRPGAETSLDLRIQHADYASLAPEDTPALAALQPQAGSRLEIHALPAGQEADFRLFVLGGESIFSFVRSPQGGWGVMARQNSDGSWRYDVPAGHYDLYLVETARETTPAYARLIAKTSGVDVAPGTSGVMRFDLPAPQNATASLRGELTGARLSFSNLSALTTVTQLHAALLPRVDVLSASGKRVATAFAMLPTASIEALLSAIDRQDEDAASSLVKGSRFRYFVRGLPPGRYSLQAGTHGRAELTLTGGSEKVLDLDLGGSSSD